MSEEERLKKAMGKFILKNGIESFVAVVQQGYAEGILKAVTVKFENVVLTNPVPDENQEK